MGAEESVEEWRTCPGGHELYELSNLGRVRSWNNNRWGRRTTPIFLKVHPNKDGYFLVSLGRGVKKAVHSMVCEAFHGPRTDGHEASHYDGDNRNNVASNLRWATPTLNADDKNRHGTTARGERHGKAVLTAAQVTDIRLMRAAGAKQVDIAKIFGMSEMTVSNIVTGKRWSGVR